LRSTDLVWLNNRYEVGFVSDLGESIASTARLDRRPLGDVFERPLASSMDTILRLTPFEALKAWWQSPRTLALLAGLLLLGAGGSLLLRREMARVARAVTAFQTEAAWRQSMEDSALVGLRARDPEGRILYVNKTLCEMVGCSSAELMGLLPPLPFWPPEAVDAMMARNLSTLAGGAPSQGFETRWRHRDGHFLDVVIFESRLVNPEGAHIGWMGSIVDISERKRLEENDRQHREALAQHARLNDMGLLASELAHELNQPLTTIVSYSAGLSLAMKKQKLDDPDVREAVEEVNRHARKAGDIVNWIRRQTSRTEPEMAPLAINTLIADVLALRSRNLQRAGVQVSTDLAPGLVATRLDGVGIERVLANLVKNACDALAGQDGQRRVTIRSSLGESRDGQAAICVAVQDNGPGLQGKTLDTLCGTFYSTKSDGMGLGLGICRSIIESHGGSFGAEDAPGGGAVFRFFLPLHAPTPTTTLSESP
jgi:two-component system sensor histidine kinase DctS